MADCILKVKNRNVKLIFNSMIYGKRTESNDLAKVWLQQHFSECRHDPQNPNVTPTVIYDVNNGDVLTTVYGPRGDLIDTIIETGVDTVAWSHVAPLERSRLMYRFAADIEENADLICQLEFSIRGVLSKDTKNKAIPLFTEYLMYYASLCLQSNKYESPKGRVTAVISDDNCLGILGSVIGPVLASGQTLLLQIGPKFSVCASLIVKLAVGAGIAESVIKLIPGHVELKDILSRKLGTIALFTNLSPTRFDSLEIADGNRIIAISKMKVPVLVFNNADIDSACDAVINAVWEYQGAMQWSTDTVIVQEDILPYFVTKLKRKLTKLCIGKGNETSVDISYPVLTDGDTKLQRMIKDARVQGIEVYQPFPQENTFQPTVFVGGRVYNNNVIIEDETDVPAATILAFRTANEGVSLANNGRQGLAASIWAENVNLINEVVRKLKVGTVWVNCHGIIKADVTFNSQKGSGLGYFGGPEGFYEFIDHSPGVSESRAVASFSYNLNNIVAAAKKAQEDWNKLSVLTRTQVLIKWAQEIDSNTVQLKSVKNGDSWVSSIYESFTELSNPNNSTKHGNYDLKTYREPLGIVAVGVMQDRADAKKAVIGALLLGNTVIVAANGDNREEYSEVAKYLPSGLLSTICDSHLNALVNHRDIRVLISSFSPGDGELVNFKEMYALQNNWKFVLRRVTQTKNVWIASGDSIA